MTQPLDDFTTGDLCSGRWPTRTSEPPHLACPSGIDHECDALCRAISRQLERRVPNYDPGDWT